jgi:membrane-associated phospholipid phosphatase
VLSTVSRVLILFLLFSAGLRAEDDTSEDSTKENDSRVSLLDNFPVTEIVINGAIGTFLATEYATGFMKDVFDEPLIPSVGSGSIDRWFSDVAYNPSGGYMHYRIPESMTYVLSFGTGIYFGLEAVTTWIMGESLIEGDINGDHKFFAFLEAYLWSQTLATTFQHLIGRRRPYIDKGLLDTHYQGWNSYASFHSGHTSNAFFAAAFMARHLGDLLERTALKDYSPQAKFWLAHFLPSLALYGLAGYASYSRIYEQQHYFTDVLAGALYATVISNLVYWLHFEDGHPRGMGKSIKVLPVSGGAGNGLSLVVRF